MEPLKGLVEITVGTRTGRYTFTSVLNGDEELFGFGSPIEKHLVGDENYGQLYLSFNGILEEKLEGEFVKQAACLIVPVDDIQVILLRQVKREPV